MTTVDTTLRLRMVKKSERLKSFFGWPVEFLSISRMVDAGFYYTKRADIVGCSFCGVEIGLWDKCDDPLQEHKRWSPSCNYILNKIPIDYETEYGIIAKNPEESQLVISLEKLGICKTKSPTFPNYIGLQSRLRSFETWPIALKQKPITLSQAGFFYTGRGDKTACFQCGGLLKDWEDFDEPWMVHAQQFPKCNFVLLVKGKKYVEEMCTRMTAMKKSKSAEVVSGTWSKFGYKMKDSTDVRTEHTSLCKICFTDKVEVVFLPCGHLVACVNCSLKLTACAICRHTISATVRVFES